MAMPVNKAFIREGTKLLNNDKRSGFSVVVVTRVTDTHVYYQAGTRKAKIALNRIYPFGTKKAQGYNLAEQNNG